MSVPISAAKRVKWGTLIVGVGAAVERSGGGRAGGGLVGAVRLLVLFPANTSSWEGLATDVGEAADSVALRRWCAGLTPRPVVAEVAGEFRFGLLAARSPLPCAGGAT